MAGPDTGRATLVAIGDLVPWPRSVADRPVTTREAGTWPAFALVVGERGDLLRSPARVLFDLLAAAGRAPGALVADGRSRWTVAEGTRALLRLELQVDRPATFDVDVLVPAQRIVGLLPAVAQGVPIGLTTSRYLRDLGSTADLQEVLRRVVVVRCPPAPGLADLADEVIRSLPPGRSR